jgi:hypothetical protein
MCTSALFDTFVEISLINITLWVNLDAFSMREVVIELTFVDDLCFLECDLIELLFFWLIVIVEFELAL